MTRLQATAAWRSFSTHRRLRYDETIAQGFDFTVVRMTDSEGRRLAVRVPRGGRYSSDLNDPHVDRRALLTQEYELARHLADHGVPVARPVELFRSDEFDALISEYLPDDGAGVDGEVLGRTLAQLHAVPPPAVRLAASEDGSSAAEVLIRRIVRRWSELARLEPGLPALPDPSALTALLPPAGFPSLLHLDVRAANLRCQGRRPALIDWANALVGDPGLELARVTEFASIPGNGIDLDGLLRGYGRRAGELAAAPAFALYRLDAALMLVLVFRSEAPHPVLGPEWTGHAVDRAAALSC